MSSSSSRAKWLTSDFGHVKNITLDLELPDLLPQDSVFVDSSGIVLLSKARDDDGHDDDLLYKITCLTFGPDRSIQTQSLDMKKYLAFGSDHNFFRTRVTSNLIVSYGLPDDAKDVTLVAKVPRDLKLLRPGENCYHTWEASSFGQVRTEVF